MQWGLAIAVVLGALAGAFFVPRERKLAEFAERDIAAAGDGDVQWSEEYQALRTRVGAVGGLAALLVLITIYFMTVQTGARMPAARSAQLGARCAIWGRR